MMSTFTAAAIQSAFGDIANDLTVSLTRASYLTSLQIAILGGAPLFWRPLSDRYGRRPIFLLSLICSAVTNIGCANSPTYATMGFCRALTAFFISPAGAIGAAVVVELFFQEREGTIHGCVDTPVDFRCAHCSLHLRVCCPTRRIPLDLLHPCRCKSSSYNTWS